MTDTLQILHSETEPSSGVLIFKLNMRFMSSSSSRNKMFEEKLKPVITHSHNPNHPANFTTEN